MKKIIAVAVFAMAMTVSNAFAGQFEVEYDIITTSRGQEVNRQSGRKVVFASDAEEAADKVARQNGFSGIDDVQRKSYPGSEFREKTFDLKGVTEKESKKSSDEE
jgi:hypothetical protein